MRNTLTYTEKEEVIEGKATTQMLANHYGCGVRLGHPLAGLIISGYTDRRGSKTYNLF
jgi:hypothetical protein